MDDAAAPPAARTRLPAAVILLGLTSFFTDVGSEMIFPLLPAFVASLGASATFLGLVEGASDATSSLLKLGAGYLADRFGKKKPLVLFGYGLAACVRPLMALAGAPWQVLAIRLSDRVGKGVRSSPRDALISASVGPEQAGRAFGLHRSMDHAGAVVGPLLATTLLAAGMPVRHVFLWTLLPGLLSVVTVALVREPAAEREREPQGAAAPATAAKAANAGPPTPLPRAFSVYLGLVLLFALGNSSDAFLLLRARELGVSAALLPTLWVVLHISKLASSYLGGSWADRAPRTRLIVLGWTIYAGVYLGLGAATSSTQVWALFIVYGLYYGLSEPAEKALVKDLAPSAVQGRAFGLYNFVVGASAVPAGLLTGFVWEHVSPRAALALGAAIAACASLGLAAAAPRWRKA